MSLRALDEIDSIDENAGTATIEAGAGYGRVCETLDERGYALRNLASLPHISIVGAAATATHGSGADNENMAVAVSGIEFIDPNGTFRNEYLRYYLYGADDLALNDMW